MAQLLQEYVSSRGVAMSVDRQVGILRGVKLIGLESRNGRRYRESALTAAVKLYEEAKVNVNHPKEGPLTPRDYQDRLGVIRGVEMRTGEGLFGDLHFNPKHSLAEQLLWDAEHNPQNVGFSHNVLARLSRDDGSTVVEEITKVQSVDLVADPATTQGLFEQTNLPPAPKRNSRWDALTLEVLQSQRPDLFKEIQSIEAGQLQEQLEAAESLSSDLLQKQQIYELLCENGLSVSKEGISEKSETHQTVSPLFVELLMSVSEEKELETLIAERAELTRSASQKQRLATGSTSPLSREQTLVFADRQEPLLRVQDFASTLKSPRS